jgi:hypothetical protein
VLAVAEGIQYARAINAEIVGVAVNVNVVGWVVIIIR